MDDQYLDAFIRESEEAITELNNSLLDLESDPSDEEAMDAIFRTAHTLKGNFGAMGFDDAANLAHAMEDLLDAMRQGEMEVTPDVMDLVFAGVDQIEVIVKEIEADGESQTQTDEMVTELRSVLEEGAEAAGETAAGGETTETDDSGDATDIAPTDIDLDPSAADGQVVHVSVSVGDSDMLGVDAMLALEAIEDVFDILASDPERPSVEDGEFEETFDLYLDAADASTVDAELGTLGKVDTFTATDVTDRFEPAGEATTEAGTDTDLNPAATEDEEHSVDEIKSVRVDVDQLDDLHGLVEQLVTSRIKLRRSVEQEDVDSAGETLNELDKITANLQNTVMDMRLIPLKKVVGKFPRLVRDLARELDKDVEFEIEGEDIELDRTILTEISDPLMHILRNSVDHGIEPPAEREAAGKPATGHITLRATRERDHVIIEVEDDGAGLDVEGIKQKAIEKGVRSPEEIEAMDDSAIYDLVFHPGFSTADEVTDTSGRGVGMDVVHDTVTQLDGSVNVESTEGEGTTVALRLPVTMAIVKVLFVEVGDEEYGVPIKNVDEITATDATKRVNGKEVIKHNDDIYPVIHLDDTFDVPGETANGDGMLIRIRESERQVALHCDSVNSQEEVVVKPLEGILSGTPGLSGTAVLGDGNIVHILDVVTL
ncbi:MULTISPECIES: chemotaxis protein CheA [Haloarcula]|uniref:Chemotaxis protein CheA n=1 Tax=Haloarcula pellucida TaxID=1427151 RepID=A0A830GQM4_9EURY|nr:MULTISPECIES: chemotaxis protein CheA [Halomicroarcula]MBX0349137.1 chemotaxis protein CheA [Halomicroarcula pellucida]MDS0279270.1 chemotaxis protein CheA [Halomicroarcula sp. S1AR25-4]GGN99206.1 chemotaxis protein CheA [Halomicroarcula pellucida]